MAVELECGPITSFDDWYVDRKEDVRTGLLEYRNLSEDGMKLRRRYEDFKREMDARCQDFDKLERLADGEVISPKTDLPNVSSGETAGLVRRMARNLVQNTPNVEILNQFDDDSAFGIMARHILLSKIIRSDTYSNDIQQHLFASTKTALTVGFDCVIPCLVQEADRTWVMEYDTIHYRDVFPEPGAKDVRKATEVYVRRYMTKGELMHIIRDNVSGWDVLAVKKMLHDRSSAPPRRRESTSNTDKKRGVTPEGYEVITWYNSAGAPFLTFCPITGMLLRIEKNKHPLKEHPVFFLILEKDNQHPLGKSQVELIMGRQEFQDLMHNGAMKLWYRNINPPLLGYGAINAVPNLSPGKYTSISNPNAKIEAFEVNTQTLMQYGSLAQQNLGSMIGIVGNADQQMATQAGNGMSATPQGVEAQQAMVDITTNNYQKAIEQFFSHYCSYALTIYFQEMKGFNTITPSADARVQLVNAGMDPELFDNDGNLSMSFSDLAVQYFVRCIPGSLIEMEDEKQLRILNQLFVPLSQAMPALAQAQNPAILANAAAALQFIMLQEIELSGANRSEDLRALMLTGNTQETQAQIDEKEAKEASIGSVMELMLTGQSDVANTIAGLQEQVSAMQQVQTALLEKLGVSNAPSDPTTNNSPNDSSSGVANPDMVTSARA